ncbi:MAG: TraR/DksA family transcriptional regulator [Planctomycetota bacterium]|nr:TraR/DksA family transcriptional regulator [Planctomycetota bacterium]
MDKAATAQEARTGSPLSAAEIAEYREALLDKREELTGQVESLSRDAASSTEATEHSKSPLNIAENASDTFEQDFAFLSIESEEELLEKVENALERIQEGGYGICEICGKPIPKVRLDLMPWADLDVNCQQLEEQGRARRNGGEFEILEDDGALGNSAADDDGAP